MGIAGNDVTIEVNKNETVTVKVTGETQITAEGSQGNVTDLRAGSKVTVKYDPGTGIASEIQQSRANNDTKQKK